MKKQTTPTELEKAGYKGTKVMSMIKAIESQEIFKHLRLVQQDEFSKVKNRYYKLGYLAQPYFSYLWNIYWNFVLNDFRFETKQELTIPVTVKNICESHIGLRMYEELINT